MDQLGEGQTVMVGGAGGTVQVVQMGQDGQAMMLPQAIQVGVPNGHIQVDPDVTILAGAGQQIDIQQPQTPQIIQTPDDGQTYIYQLIQLKGQVQQPIQPTVLNINRNLMEEASPATQATSAAALAMQLENIVMVDKENPYVGYGRPYGSDFHQLKSLISDVFVDIPIDLDSLVKFIIKNKLTQVAVEFYKNENGINADSFNVSAIATSIDLDKSDELKNKIVDLSKKYASNWFKKQLDNLMSNHRSDMKFVISTRHEYASPELCTKILNDILRPITDASNGYIIFITKIFKVTEKSREKKTKDEEDAEEIIYINCEDEVFAQEAVGSFEFCIDPNKTNPLPNEYWGFGPEGWDPKKYDNAVPYRRVLLIKSEKIEKIRRILNEKFNY